MRLTWSALNLPDWLYWTVKGNQKVDFPFKGIWGSLGETTGSSCTPTNRLKVLAAWHSLRLPPPFNAESPRRRRSDVRLRGWAERKDKAWLQERKEINSVRCCTVRTFVTAFIHFLHSSVTVQRELFEAFICSLVLHELCLTWWLMQGISCNVLLWTAPYMCNYELTVEDVCLKATTATWLIRQE